MALGREQVQGHVSVNSSITVGRVQVSLPSVSVVTSRTTLKDRRIAIHRSLPPVTILREKPKATAKVTLRATHQLNSEN